MRHGVKIDGQFLDLFDDTGFDFSLTSPAYFGGTSDVIQNSLVFTVRVPTTPRNAVLLKHPHVVSNAKRFLEREYAELWADGGLLFDGQLTVTEANDTNISFRILINAAGELKNLLLKDTNLNTAVNLGGTPTDFAKTTATNPLDADVIFFPVYNADFENAAGLSPVIPQQWQNFYDTTTQAFTNGGAVTPFIRLDYILRKMFETIGFTLINQFQTTDELKRLVLYNNYDARVNSLFPATINLKNHVPQKIKCGEFLNKLCRLFNLAPFVDSFGKTVELAPMLTAFNEIPAYDWSDKLLTDWNLSQEALEIPAKIGYKDYLQYSGRTYRYEQDFSNISLPNLAKIESLAPTNTEGVYYETTTNTYYAIVATGQRPVVLTRQINPLKSATAKGEPFLNDMVVPLNDSVSINDALDQAFPPFLKVEGSKATKTVEPPLMLMLYRSMQPSTYGFTPAPGPNYPHASLNVYNAMKDRCGTDAFSLHFDGEFGIGKNCLGDWYEMLQNKKDLTARFNLTIAELRQFSFRKKVHIKGMDYFVKSIKGRVTGKGLTPVEADLCTAIF